MGDKELRNVDLESDGPLPKQVLRRAAVAAARQRWNVEPSSISYEDALHLLHELRVHQIELEMQNEELRRTQDGLETARARYFDHYDLAPVGYLTLSEDDVILEANLRASTLLGVPRGALPQQSLTRFIGPEQQDLYYLHRSTLLRTLEPQTCELHMRQPSGERLWLRIEETVLFDERGEFRVRNAALSDISRERALMTRQSQADRLATMSILAAGVAHEINNPLTYVLYNVETLAEELPLVAGQLESCRLAIRKWAGDEVFAKIVAEHQSLLAREVLEQQVTAARQAVEGARRIEEVTKGLGLFSTVDAEEVRAVDLNLCLQHILKLANNGIRHVATLATKFDPVPRVLATEGKLAQVLLNLLINAAHAITTGNAEGNRIELRTWTERGKVWFEIADTGCGIRPENLELAFEPFFTTKGASRGTGLGLSIARRIVREFGGDIELESEVGRGTQVRVWLSPLEGEAVLSRLDAPTALKARARILVVDDEPCVCIVANKILSSAHDVVVVSTATDAQLQLQANPHFELILCDLNMTPMTGIDLHLWLKERFPDLANKLVFITGGVFAARVQQYLEETGLLCIEKPFRKTDLLRQVAEWLKAHESA